MLAASQCGARTPLSPLAQATLEKHLPSLSSTKRLIQQSQSQTIVQKSDVGCLTDICNHDQLPEVEIFSLLEEKIPKYKIRADILTEFGGYQNQDWFIPAPTLPIPPEGLELTKDQIRETLNYFLLCGNRVSQMTRAYNDIEAVTRLLEEKEKDLELTVQIGKELLTQNNRLESRITDLESELKLSNEDRAQLLHDLHQKNELIAVLTNYADDSSENDTPTLSKSITLDLLQKKIVSLQDENKSLKMETSQLVKKTDEVEEQERKLMADITVQLNSTNNEFDNLNLELERQKEENRLQHEQIVSLTSRLTEAEIRLHQLTTENDEQISLLSITKENQNLLTTELAEFKVRYQEVLSLLQEAQEQLRNFRKKQTPHARSSFISSLGMPPQPDSLHSELMESSLYSENSLDSGICADRLGSALSGRMSIGGNGIGNIGGNNINLQPYRKIFETVQCASKNGNYSDGMSHLGGMSMALSSSSGPRMATGLNNPAGSYHRPSSVYSGSTYPSYDSSSLGIKTLSCESLQSQSDDIYPTQPNGVPGAPGAKDLEAALKRLTPSEVLVRRAMLSHAPIGTYSYDDQHHQSKDILPFGIRTPDSIMSTGSSSRLSNMSGLSSSDRNQWRLPEKLQIIKPMEGSQTLHHWSRLATPTLSGLLEDRPGVKIRGGRGLEDLGLQVYSLSDVEEDVDDLPGKQYQAACVYTYTTSHVMHPDDGLTSDLSFLSQSQLSSRMASTSTSRQPSCPATPRGGLSRRNSCSTFSVNMGLASMLNERGIKAVTPSALNTPAGPNFTPTVTPYNSPEGSPTRSMSPEPLFGILSTGADMIRRKLIGEYNRPIPQQRNNTPQNKQQKIMLSRLEKRALRSLRLLEKVESIGLENIIATQPNAMSQLVSGIASRSASPMAQLTSLKNLQTPNNNYVDDMHFNRSQIRSVLSKGLSNDSLKSIDGESDLLNSINSDDSCSELFAINYNNSSSSNSQTPKPLKPSPKFYNSSIRNNESSFPKLKNHKQNEDVESTTMSSTNVPSTSTTTNSETSDIRLKQMQRQKSRRNIKNGQRPDLGTVNGGGNGRVRPDLGKVDQNSIAGSQQQHNNNYREDRSDAIAMAEAPEPTQTLTQSFVGSISSIFFGRKGGWL